MIRFYNFEQRSPIWYTYRKDKWTGSTAIDLLKGKKTPPDNDSDYDNKYMQRGRILESLAIEAYEKENGVLGEVKHFGFITNSKYKHAGYSPDGIDGDVLIEVKCLNEEDHLLLKEKIAVKYIAQIEFGLLITELTKARLIGYNPDSSIPLIIVDVESDWRNRANLIKHLKATEPKRKPSQMRAQQRYIKNNPMKIKESNHKRYIKSKVKLTK